MIKSTKTTLDFSNTTKKESLCSFINEYKRVVSIFIDKLWDLSFKDIPTLLPIAFTKDIESWISKRAIQCAAKQASGIVRGVKTKQEKRLFIINKLLLSKCFKKARKLQRIYDNAQISKPSLELLQPELDSRFVKTNLDNNTSFDGWITLSSLGKKIKLILPFKKHKHFNKMLRLGQIKSGIRLSKKLATFMFEIEEPKTIQSGNTLGIDIGQNTILSCSNGQIIDRDKHNHNYRSICERLARRTKGSKRFNKTVTHRTNYIHWSVNQLNLNGIKTVNRENIKYLRKGKSNSRVMSHWNYSELFDKLDRKIIDSGVQINKFNPTYTSQRCSFCGWVCKRNRKQKRFRCVSCGFAADADLNASVNLSLSLIPFGNQQQLLRLNRKEFYWYEVGKEPIVPYVPKTNKIAK